MSVGLSFPQKYCEGAERSLSTAVSMFEDGLGEVRRGAPQPDSVICTQPSAVGAHVAK